MMFLTLYMFAVETYACIQTDYLSDEEPVYIKYSDLLSEDEGFFNQLYDFLLDEKANEDYVLYEKIAVFTLFGGLFFQLIGILNFIKNKKILLCSIGVLLNCVSCVILYTIIKKAETAISASLLGSLEIFLGKAVTFDTSSGVFLTFTVILAVAFFVCSYFYYTTKEQEDNLEKED